MAQPIQDPTVGAALQALFGLQGRVRPYLEEYVIPTVRIADLSQGATPAISRHAIARISAAAVAGQQFIARLEIIPNVIAVIRRLVLEPDADTKLLLAFPGNAANLGPQATTADKGFTDGRILAGSAGGAQSPAGVLTFGTGGGPYGTQQGELQLFAAVANVYEPTGWVVGTGRPDLFGFLEMHAVSANVGLVGQIEWDEYTLT